MSMVKRFLLYSCSLVIKTHPFDNSGSFCSLFCILCVQNKGFKFSFFFLFYAIFLQLFMYFYRFLKATFTDSVSLLRLTMSSLYTSVLGVTTGNFISSSREHNGLLLNVLSISRSIFSFRSSSFVLGLLYQQNFQDTAFLIQTYT